MVCSIKVDGQKVVYRRFHHGRKTILLIHGFAIGAEIWTTVLPHLTDYTVITLDLPGYGLNRFHSGGPSIIEQAGFVHRFIETYRPVDYLVGYSFGGRIVYKLCETYNLSVKKVICIAAPFFTHSHAKYAIRQTLVNFTKTAVLSKSALYLGTTNPTYKQIIKRWKLADVNNTSLLTKVKSYARRKHNYQKVVWGMADVFQPFVRKPLLFRNIFFIYGQHDGSATYSRTLSVAGNSKRIFMIPHVYHLIPLEAAEDLADVLKRMLPS